MKYSKLFFLLFASLLLTSCGKEIEFDGGTPEKKIVISPSNSYVDLNNLTVGQNVILQLDWNFPASSAYVKWSASNDNVCLSPSSYSSVHSCTVEPLAAGTTVITAEVDGITTSIDVTVKKLTPSFTATANGYYKATYTIQNSSYEYDSFKWDFGDGYTNTTYSSVIKTYSYSGWYTVTLTLYKNGKSYSTSKSIYIYY